MTEDGVVLFTDDHEPEPRMSEWEAGQRHTYVRPVFTHRQFPGRLDVVLGLFDPGTGTRVQLGNGHVGRGEHHLAALQVDRAGGEQSGAPIYGPGFYGPEGDTARPFVTYRWMSRKGVVSFRNPRADAVLFLTTRPRLPDPEAASRLEVAVGSRVRAMVVRDQWALQAVWLSQDDLGAGDWTDIELGMEHEYRGGTDNRPLALCVENAALVPVERLDPLVVALADDGKK